MAGLVRVLFVLVLAILLTPPLASAQATQFNETLSDLEEKHSGTDKTWDVLVTAEEAGKQRAVAFLNPAQVKFALVVTDANGTVVYNKNGTLGLQTLPALQAGPHKFAIVGTGSFLVTDKAFERTIPNNVTTTIKGGVDVYAAAPSRYYDLLVNGSVSVEFLALAGKPIHLDTPVNHTLPTGNAFLITVRGDENTPYSIAIVPAEPPAVRSPAPEVVLVLALFLGLALVLRRRT